MISTDTPEILIALVLRSSSRSACWSPCTSSVISGSRDGSAFGAALLDRLRQAALEAHRRQGSRRVCRSPPIPLGGYVKLLDEREGNVAPPSRTRAFNRQPVWKRIVVLLAGPAFNLHVRHACLLGPVHRGVPALKPVVGDVDAGLDASRAGLKTEDEIRRSRRQERPIARSRDVAAPRRPDRRRPINLRVRGDDGGERELLARCR